MSPVEIYKVQPSSAVRDENTLAGVWEAKENDRKLIVGISVKNTLPSYILCGYTIKYNDGAGNLQTIALPDMQPGEKYDIPVPDINNRFKFDVCRPDGRACLNY